MTEKFIKNTKNLKIKTDVGFVDFEGIAEMGVKRVYNITFDDGVTVGATSTHCFFTPDERNILTGELEPGTVLLGDPVDKTVVKVEYVGEMMTYDVINTETHTFLVNGVLSHNCVFISNDPLLIDTVVLSNITSVVEKIKPVAKSGDVVFYAMPNAGTTYLVGMDPSTGSGSDFTTILAYEFPSMTQVAEYRSNTASSVTGYHMLKKVLQIFSQANASVYFTVEANGVGEAILALMEADEHPIDTAEFISETGQRRKGMTTTGRTKLKGCLALKEMVERNNLHVKSKSLVFEMKNFVRKAGSYAAKVNATDDLVMATVLVVRMLEEIATYDQEAYDKMYSDAYGDTSSEWDKEDDGMGVYVG